MVLGLILVDGLVYAAWLFTIAVGLTLIFGVMKVLNVAHGAFYAIGAYASATAIGIYTTAGLPPAGIYLAMALAAIVSGLVIGLALERLVLRTLYDKNEIIAVLATYAAFLMIEDALLMIFGRQGIFAYAPYMAAGNLQIGSVVISYYDMGLICFAGALALAGWFCLHRTRFGRMLFAVIYSRETAAAFGVNVTRVFILTFIIGSVLGALGGALTAPKISVAPGIGVEVIVIAFAVVAVGGMGSIEGTLIAALLVGLCRAAAVHLLPSIEVFIVYLVMAVVLIVRPYGLFTRTGARVI
ncbi:MAG: branched-chain amino acid ABC transporter permease [Xanthobacteraceae bacterium]